MELPPILPSALVIESEQIELPTANGIVEMIQQAASGMLSEELDENDPFFPLVGFLSSVQRDYSEAPIQDILQRILFFVLRENDHERLTTFHMEEVLKNIEAFATDVPSNFQEVLPQANAPLTTALPINIQKLTEAYKSARLRLNMTNAQAIENDWLALLSIRKNGNYILNFPNVRFLTIRALAKYRADNYMSVYKDNPLAPLIQIASEGSEPALRALEQALVLIREAQYRREVATAQSIKAKEEIRLASDTNDSSTHLNNAKKLLGDKYNIKAQISDVFQGVRIKLEEPPPLDF